MSHFNLSQMHPRWQKTVAVVAGGPMGLAASLRARRRLQGRPLASSPSSWERPQVAIVNPIIPVPNPSQARTHSRGGCDFKWSELQRWFKIRVLRRENYEATLSAHTGMLCVRMHTPQP